MRPITRVLLLSALAAALSTSSWAVTLLGSTVTGSLTFPGSGANAFNPSTTTIVYPGVEFGYADVFNRISANFGSLDLEITDQSLSPGTNNPEQFVFMDSAFVGLSLVPGSNNYPVGFTSSLVGNTLTINAPAELLGTATYQAEFAFSPAAAPEPSSYLLFGTLLLGLTPVIRRQLRSRQ